MPSKRFLLTVLLAACAIAATGCSSESQPSDATTEKLKTIGVSLASDTNPFYVSIRRGIDKRAEELGVTLIYVQANEDVAKQINSLQDLVTRNVDGIIASPIDTVAIGAGYAFAGQAGIPVISVVRFSKSPHELRAVTMNWSALGREIGEHIIASVGDRNGKVAVISGPTGAKLFVDLTAGVKAALSEHPNIETVFETHVPLTREAGLRAAEDVLAAHPDIDAIYGANDEVGLGAVQAARAVGRDGDVYITGLNGVPPAVQAVEDGSLSLTYDLNAELWGKVSLDTILAYTEGRTPTDEEIDVRWRKIDRASIAGTND